MKAKGWHSILVIISTYIYASCVKLPATYPTSTVTPDKALPESSTPYPIPPTELSTPSFTSLAVTPTQISVLSGSTPTFTDSRLANGYIVPAINMDDLAYLSASAQSSGHINEALFLHFSQSNQYSLLDMDDSYPTLLDDTLLGTGSTMFRIGFANFANWIAYEDNQANFWIADLLNNRPILILTAPITLQDELLFTWSPDDQHLIVDFDQPEISDLIFHLQTGQWEVWNYVCDRLAYSPHSQEISIWCPSVSNNNFMVLEWGGESWYSEQPPEQEVLTSYENTEQIDKRFNAFPLYRNTGWSSDGDLIAYYDPQDDTGALTIMNSYGEVQRQIPGMAYWLTDFYQENPNLPGSPIQWSLDGSRLLVLAIGKNTNPCSDFTSTFNNRTYPNPGCWQLLDPATGETIWQDSSLPYNTNVGIFIRNQYYEVTISRHGQYISLCSLFPADNWFYIINVETSEILYARAWSIFRMRWGAGP
jgi:hypothetical protein